MASEDEKNALDIDPFATMQRFFVALSDEERLRIAGVLAAREATVQELTTLLEMRAAAVGRHLATLAEAGIIRSTQRGALTSWSLDVDRLREQRRHLLARERIASTADEAGTPEWERSVLANFFEGERLKEIPASLKKRHVVLSWLVDRFERDRHYHEREVNEIIKRHHPDASALRRELVDHRYMQRENGIYWRIERRNG